MTYDGNCRLGDLFISRREKGHEGLPTLSVTLNNGLVDREDLARKMETNLAESEHLLVRKGDIAYNMMRMWQGASGLATKDGLVSPAYVVLKPRQTVDSRFASYLLKTKRLIYLLWAYSYGLTDDRLRLYFDDFCRIPVNVPEVKEQRRIADVLATWDRAIETVEKLIENSKVQKKALTHQLLTEAKQTRRSRENWMMVRLGDLVVLNPPRSACPADGRVSFVPMDAVSEEADLEYTLERRYADLKIGFTAFRDDDILVAKITPCFENGKGAILRNLINGVGFGSTEFHVLRPKKEVFPRLIYHVVNSREFRIRGEANMQGSAGQRRVPTGFLKLYRFLYPSSYDEQVKIATALDNLDSQHRVLKVQREFLTRERGALAQKLFSGKRHVKLVTPSPNPAVA